MTAIPGKPPIGVLGGTFDPIHYGHLRLAVELRDRLGLASVRLVPSARPPHRQQPEVGPGQRAKWVRMAIINEPGLILDDRELIRPGESYTVDTLESLRRELPDTPLCLALGEDAYAGLTDWHRWRELLDLGHIIVVPRPGFEADTLAELAELEAEYGVRDPKALSGSLAGHIFRFDLPPLAITGSEIRRLIRNKMSPRYLLPADVLRDIEDGELYRRERAD